MILTDHLPIDQHLGSIVASLDRCASVIVKADTGVGKTTRLPPYLIDRIDGKVIVLEPRRLAAKLTAERIAEERGEAIGETVGYRIRHESKVSAKTSLLFVTEGVFLRMLQDDPALNGIGYVVLDEFHERNIYSDLALGLVRQLQKSNRRDLKLVVMSATIDTAALETYLEDGEVHCVTTKHHPLTINYLPAFDKESREGQVLRAVETALGESAYKGNILVFLTGSEDIRRVKSYLSDKSSRLDVDVMALSASTPAKEQQRVFQPSQKRKVICATNVAETSLTIPQVDTVIDLGEAKIAGHAPWSGVPTLEIKKVSKASLIQRAGRAGRTGPGLVFRLFSEADFLSRPDYSIPDIQRLDLSADLLSLINILTKHDRLQDSALAKFGWFEEPHEDALAAALTLLKRLSALDSEGSITEFGKNLAALPLHPRLAAIALTGKKRDYGPDSLLASCMLNEGFILSRTQYALEKAPCDLCFQMDLLKAVVNKQELPYSVLEKTLSKVTISRIAQLYKSLASRLGYEQKILTKRTDHSKLKACLLAGFPDRVAKLQLKKQDKRQSKKKRASQYQLCLGRGGLLNSSSVIQNAELIIILDATERLKDANGATATMIWAASEIDIETLECDRAGFLSFDVESRYDSKRDLAEVMEVTFYGNIRVCEQPIEQGHQDISQFLATTVLKSWPRPFLLSDLASYEYRVQLLETINLAEGQIDLSDLSMRELFLHTICEGKTSLKQLAEQSLLDYIYQQLSYEQQQLLEKYTPSQLRLENGRCLPIEYNSQQGATISGFVQDFFGLAKTPRILKETLVLRVCLLAPNKRPSQITSDLQGFWQTGYEQLARELKRRYPKHYWPDDPVKAKPILLKKNVNGS